MKSFSALGILAAGILGAAVFTAAASAQDNSGLHARELFYTPPPDSAPATAKPATSNKLAPKRTAPPAQQTSKTEAKAPAAPAASSAPASSSPAASTVSVHTVAVAAVPLGVRYSVLKRNPAGQFVEVDPDTTFHSGDRIRLQVKANTDGYLYVVTQGSSGNWQVLFPSSNVAGGSNRLQPGDTRQIPQGGAGQFVFDDQGGTEKLFLVLSRQAEPDLDKLIYAVGGGAAPASQGSSRMLMAKATVTNDVIERLRSQVASRDLVFEKDPEVDGKVENAAYVVNPSTSPDARLVVDVNLKHQ